MLTFRTQKARSANTLVLVIGFVVLAGFMVAASSTSSVATVRNSHHRLEQMKTRAAVDAVLQRRESDVIVRAKAGSLLTWTGDLNPITGVAQAPNYGVDYFGDCEVRWRIEPVRTPTKEDLNVSTEVGFVTNPKPDSGIDQLTNEQENSFIFLFRVAAEARFGQDANGQPLAVAQGVRYVSVNEQPLFRYVIFYAQSGPKGDLEFSHGPAVNINGDVHSNGAIYLGSGTLVNTWGASSPANGNTILGPSSTNGPVSVTGVDGIFRMSKQVMYGEFNQANVNMIGANSGTALPALYALDNIKFPGEATMPNVASVDTATNGGKVINPYRVTNLSASITGNDNKRIINTVAVHGDVGATPGNDSRDASRADPFKFPVVSVQPLVAGGWSGRVDSALTGGSQVRIPSELTGGVAVAGATSRPLEAQQIIYQDLDGDPSTDAHEASQPVFHAAGTTTVTLPTSGAYLEEPGQFMSFALGKGMFMERELQGWKVVTESGALPATEPQKAGLVIRERPIPATNIWPGTKVVSIIPPGSPDFMPFAYGKHWRPVALPFTPVNITDNMIQGANPFSSINVSADQQLVSYIPGGGISATAAANPGPDFNGGSSGGSGIFSYTRRQYFQRENWRFIHMGAGVPSTNAGLDAYYFNDHEPSDNGSARRQFQNENYVKRVDANLDFDWSGAKALPTGIGANSFSVRWVGWIRPNFTDTVVFKAVADDAVRIWIDGDLILEQRSYNGNNDTDSISVPMQNGQFRRIVVEMSEFDGGENMNLYWVGNSFTRTIVPTSVFFRDTTSADFNRDTIASITMKIDTQNTNGPDLSKFGIMVRDNNGLSPLQSGGARYAAALWNPKRGFFTQERLEASRVEEAQAEDTQYFVGRAQQPPGPISELSEGTIQVTPNSTGVTRYATVKRVNQIDNFPSSPTQTSTPSSSPDTNDWGPTNVGSSTIQISLGDGSPQQTVNIGQRKFNRTVTPKITRSWTGTKTIVFDLDASTASPRRFIGSDVGKNITLYSTGAAGSGTFSSFRIAAVQNSGTRITGVWTDTQSKSVDGPSVSPLVYFGNNSATDVTVWKSTIKKADTTTMTMIEVVTWMKANLPNGSKYQLATSPQTKTWGSGAVSGWVKYDSSGLSQPVGGNTTASLSFNYPTGQDPAALSVTVPNFGSTSYTFSVNRSATKVVDFDINSFISARTQWFTSSNSAWLTNSASTNVWAYLPWDLDWNGVLPAAQVVPPLTGSFRPDVWSGMTAPVNGSAAASITGLGAGAGSATDGRRWSDDLPVTGMPAANAWQEVWLRLDVRRASGRTYLQPKYYYGATAPANDASYLSFKNEDNSDSEIDITNFSSELQIGPCFQSGDKDQSATLTASNLSVTLTDNTLINGPNKWDALSGAGDQMSAYLASQYQAFWGPYEITEDFFSFMDNSTRICSEDWIYNPREFWSQPRAWEDGTAKDAGTLPDGSVNIANRLLWAKQTLLTVDFAVLQNYIQSRSILTAMAMNLTSTPLPTNAPTTDWSLKGRFNGLVYAARTNRYPWTSNPGVNNSMDRGTVTGIYPNGLSGNDNQANLSGMVLTAVDGIHPLQPYGIGILPIAPAIMPQDFHHAVRVKNAADINWGYSATPTMSESKTSFVTPNQLFLQGDVNSATRTMGFNGGTGTGKVTPIAFMGDVVTLLSNDWTDLPYRSSNLIIKTSGGNMVSGSSPLASDNGTAASTTTYNTCIVTHNQPTNQASIIEGQAAPFIDTLLFLENWGNSNTMNFKGSLVVMDSRRYTRAFLLDAPRNNGRSVMGTLGWNALAPYGGTGTADWTGQTPQVYAAPTRVFAFQPDLLTEEGTPPFTPFGVTTSGVGGWIRAIR